MLEAERMLGEHTKAIPYGVYDLGNDEGWVSVGDVADTAEFPVESIRRWWNTLGRVRFPDATWLMITADAGGSNGYRVRAWKWHLARLAAETGLEITVCHYPPGTSSGTSWDGRGWPLREHEMLAVAGRRGYRLDIGVQSNPQQVWCRAAGPRIVAASTNPRFSSHQSLPGGSFIPTQEVV